MSTFKNSVPTNTSAGATILGGLVVGVFFVALMLGLFMLFAWLLSIAWAAAIPAMFPGLVKAGYLASSLTFHQSMWVLLLMSFLRPSVPSRTVKSKE